MNRGFWRGRRVFVTGHTGFKGTWLTRWLTLLGAEVTGYSLPDDVRDLEQLRAAMHAGQPEIVMHLAAQALVRASYGDPLATFTTNVTGSVHVLECVRALPSVRVAVMVTSDKSYANSGGHHAFREDDPLGGRDPYSASKACAELAIAAYRDSYFTNGPRVISVRAGNVIGGGDWSKDRLVPDLVRAFRGAERARIRYPEATRPWQFVLDALHGYLRAAECAWERELPHAFNFGPDETQSRSVRWLADTMAARWGDGASWYAAGQEEQPHEAPTLALDSTRARTILGWKPLLDAESAVAWTTDWYKSARDRTAEQLERFMEAVPE